MAAERQSDSKEKRLGVPNMRVYIYIYDVCTYVFMALGLEGFWVPKHLSLLLVGGGGKCLGFRVVGFGL